MPCQGSNFKRSLKLELGRLIFLWFHVKNFRDFVFILSSSSNKSKISLLITCISFWGSNFMGIRVPRFRAIFLHFLTHAFQHGSNKPGKGQSDVGQNIRCHRLTGLWGKLAVAGCSATWLSIQSFENRASLLRLQSYFDYLRDCISLYAVRARSRVVGSNKFESP